MILSFNRNESPCCTNFFFLLPFYRAFLWQHPVNKYSFFTLVPLAEYKRAELLYRPIHQTIIGISPHHYAPLSFLSGQLKLLQPVLEAYAS